MNRLEVSENRPSTNLASKTVSSTDVAVLQDISHIGRLDWLRANQLLCNLVAPLGQLGDLYSLLAVRIAVRNFGTIEESLRGFCHT